MLFDWGGGMLYRQGAEYNAYNYHNILRGGGVAAIIKFNMSNGNIYSLTEYLWC